MNSINSDSLLDFLCSKSKWVYKETLKIHKNAPETRIASSLSAVETLVSLFYGNILKFDPKNLKWEQRDRFIVSKGHGSIALYPIFADLGFYSMKELENVCVKDSVFGSIPDTLIPGYETINGSLGHGLGVGCGFALALKRKKIDADVFVLVGDGELYEGAVWEAVMFAGHHKIDNLKMILDNNKICMMGYCKDILNLEELNKKFEAFGWSVERGNGHNMDEIYNKIRKLKHNKNKCPKLLIADTVKGNGVPGLQTDSLCHVKSLKPEQVDEVLSTLE
ncbi:transketolase [bacterium]